MKQSVVRVEREEGLEDRLRLATQINNASIDQIIAIDKSKNIISCNKTCADIWGLNCDESLGQSIAQAFPEMYLSPKIQDSIDRALQGFKCFVPVAQGEYGKGYFEHHFIPLKDNNSSVTGVLIVIHDVAHRVKNENRLISLNNALEIKNKEVRQKTSEILSFAKIAAHDLKEPARKLHFFSSLILKHEYSNLSEEGKERLTRMGVAAEHISTLLDNVLLFTELNFADSFREKVSLLELFSAAEKKLQKQEKVKSVVIHVEQLPPVTGNVKMIRQLVNQLIDNSIKFRHENSEPEIFVTGTILPGNEITHQDAISSVNYLKVSIKDNGIGIDMRYSERIFEIFQRLHPAEYPGTGIGLALCKKIIELHHGFITVESSLNNGCTFNCYFPVS